MAMTADDAQAHRALNLGKPGKRYLGIGRSYLHASNRNALGGARTLTETLRYPHQCTIFWASSSNSEPYHGRRQLKA